jgi:hypothetical protein
MLENVLRLMGIPVSTFEARRLVATLSHDGGEDALGAAAVIRKGLDAELDTVALTREQGEAILAILEHPRDRLGELREVLQRGREQQLAS